MRRALLEDRLEEGARLPLAAVALVLGIVLLASVAHAQKPDVQGTYVLDRGASDDVQQAIEDVIADMNGLQRPVARLRLRALNQPPHRIDVAFPGADVSITTDEREVVQTPADGRPVRWKRDDGEEFAIRTLWENRTLKRTFHADDGERANTYDFGTDGSTLTMTVVLTSPQLPTPLTYTLVYKRTSR